MMKSRRSRESRSPSPKRSRQSAQSTRLIGRLNKQQVDNLMHSVAQNMSTVSLADLPENVLKKINQRARGRVVASIFPVIMYDPTKHNTRSGFQLHANPDVQNQLGPRLARSVIGFGDAGVMHRSKPHSMSNIEKLIKNLDAHGVQIITNNQGRRHIHAAAKRQEQGGWVTTKQFEENASSLRKASKNLWKTMTPVIIN